MKKMYKISITGKANSGKNTISNFFIEEIHNKIISNGICDSRNFEAKKIAFADPIKQMIRIAYPEIPRKWLYGSSKYRAKVINGAFKNGVPLTVRQLLIDLGNDFGRAYKQNIWLSNFDIKFNKLIKKNPELIILTDCRFRNEFDHLKKLGFFHIRLLRKDHTKINDISETNQDGISNNEFDYIIYNDGSLEDLKLEVKKIVSQL